MSDSMIERCANAIYARWETYPEYATVQMNGHLAADLARAAIEAMLSPEPRMIAATLPLIAEPTQEQRELGTLSPEREAS